MKGFVEIYKSFLRYVDQWLSAWSFYDANGIENYSDASVGTVTLKLFLSVLYTLLVRGTRAKKNWGVIKHVSFHGTPSHYQVACFKSGFSSSVLGKRFIWDNVYLNLFSFYLCCCVNYSDKKKKKNNLGGYFSSQFQPIIVCGGGQDDRNVKLLVTSHLQSWREQRMHSYYCPAGSPYSSTIQGSKTGVEVEPTFRLGLTIPINKNMTIPCRRHLQANLM